MKVQTLSSKTYKTMSAGRDKVNNFMSYVNDPSKHASNQEAYNNSPEMVKRQQMIDAQKALKKGAASAYAKGGDQALADHYLNADPKVSTRGQTNPAKLVKAGKTTFADVAKEEQQSMKAAAGQYANSSVKPNLMYENGEFDFALGGSGKDSNYTPPDNAVSAQPVDNETTNTSEDSKYTWQKSKEKAQAWQAENDKVNQWKKTFDFSAKTFTGG